MCFCVKWLAFRFTKKNSLIYIFVNLHSFNKQKFDEIQSQTINLDLFPKEIGNSNETSQVITGTLNMLNGKETISADIEKEIQQLVLGTDQITKIHVYNVSDVNKNFEDNISPFEYTRKATPAYEYGRTVWAPEWLYNYGLYEFGSGEWYVAVEFKRLGSFLTLVSLVGVAVYLTLFTVWATINAYQHKRLNLGWVTVFALLNVNGYFIYLLVGNRKVKV